MTVTSPGFVAEALKPCCWPLNRLGEAMHALARESGLSPRPLEADGPACYDEAIDRWVDSAAQWMGFEAEAVETSYAESYTFLLRGGPALLSIAIAESSPSSAGMTFLALSGSRRGRLILLDPDGRRHQVDPALVHSAVCSRLEEPLRPGLEHVLREAGIVGKQAETTRAAILREQLAAERVTGCWLLRAPMGGRVLSQIATAGLVRRLVTLGAAHLVFYILWILSWWLIGQGALQGRLDPGWLLAWGLILFSMLPFRLLATWSQGAFAIRAGALLKQRLLFGALRLDPEEIRHQGLGQLLGRVIESEAVESLALNGGFFVVFAALELLLAFSILLMGGGTWIQGALLVAWSVLTIGLGWQYYKTRRRWTTERIAMTNDLVERMVGHRTRLAQQPREQWHHGEDQRIEQYLDLSKRMDHKGSLLLSVMPRGWLLLGLVGLAPAFIAGGASTATLAIALGGTLVALRAFQKLAAGLCSLADAAIAWDQIALLFHAAARPAIVSPPDITSGKLGAAESSNGHALLEAHDVGFRYVDRGNDVLHGCNLRINVGERLLLEGASGGGKSTLASLLAGLRRPRTGMLLLNGLDFETLGPERWRQRVAAAPQFHENHVLTGTFAFNVLMGLRWPAHPDDLKNVESICRELGLGDVLDRMPAGLLQMVGETGWQLSHGEKSRLFIARALAQNSDLVILDESFAALDPENLKRALQCVLKRASTVLVIAHP